MSVMHEALKLLFRTAGAPYQGDMGGVLYVAMTPVVDKGG